jgi:hypothetical protein
MLASQLAMGKRTVELSLAKNTAQLVVLLYVLMAYMSAGSLQVSRLSYA